MSQNLTTFDMAALLDSDEAISEYLSQVLADEDSEEFLRAIGYVAKARGMAQIAKDPG
jgi:probable addiction module antidote protein